MKIIIYIGHPAQYHFFRHIIPDLISQDHSVKLLIKSKDILETLLIEDGATYENILPEGRKDNKTSMLAGLIKRDYRLWKIARKFQPDLFIGSDPSLSHVAFVTRKPCIMVGEDDYKVIRKLAWLTLPFASHILTPAVCNMGPWEYKKIPFEGYMKLAYLHPSVFMPDRKKVNLPEGTEYCIIRLAKLSAHHDTQIRGLDPDTLQQVIEKLRTHGIKVFIDSEYPLPADLLGFKLLIPKNAMHHYMAFAKLIISDSQSMSVEAAMLGIPSIRFSDFTGKISVLEELEHRYGMTFGINPSEPERLIEKLDELLNTKNLRDIYSEKCSKLAADKINVKNFMVWFIDKYPMGIVQAKQGELMRKMFNPSYNGI